MSLNRGSEGFTDDGDLTTTPTGAELSPKLVRLTSKLGLPLASRSLIHAAMPPLASHIWRQLSSLKEISSRLAGWLSRSVGVTLTSPPAIRLPVVPPTLIPTLGRLVTHLPARWPLLDLIWPRQLQKREKKFTQTEHITVEKQLVNDTIDNRWADSPSIKSLPARPIIRTESPYTTDGFFPRTYVTTEQPLAKRVADELEGKDTGESTAPHIDRSKISAIYQAEQIQKPSHLYDAEISMAQASWQPRHTYQRQWLDKVQSPFIQRLVPYRVPIIKEASNIIRQSISGAYTTPVPILSHLTITRARAKHGNLAAMHPSLPYIHTIAEPVTRDEEIIEAMAGHYWSADLEKRDSLLYSSSAQSEPPKLGAAMRRLGQSTILRTKSSTKELWFNAPMLSKKPISDLLTRATFGQVPEISQAGWSAPLVTLLPEIAEIVRQRAKVTSISKDSGSIAQSPITVPIAAADTISLSQGLKLGQSETPLIYRESVPTVVLRPQPSLIAEGIYQMPVLPVQRYFKKPARDAVPPDRSESFDFLLNQKYEPSSPGYRDTRQRVLEMPSYSIAEPRIYSKTSGDEESLVTAFTAAPYYRSRPTPELALAPVGRLAEEVSQIQLNPAEEALETEEEEEPLDIDALAREVYSKLRWRLKTDRERERGLS